jgi:ribosomal protein RSM22 (predicted rRNA methylase)
MTPSGDFIETLAALATKRAGRLSGLKRDLELIHEGFTSGRGGRPADYLRSEKARLAYLASIAIPNTARALHVLRASGAELTKGQRALDAGAGTGAAALALASRSHPDSEIVLVDQSEPALELAAELFARLFKKGPRVTTVVADVRQDLPPGRFDTVLAGHLLNELLPRRGRAFGDALTVARTLAGRTAEKGRLIFLEPAQRIPSRALSGIREKLVSTGLRPIFPCTHAGPCPVLAPRAKDWCVVDVPFKRPPLVVQVDQMLGTNRGRLTLSCLVLSRVPAAVPDRAAEILSEPMKAGEDTLLYLCGPRGRLVVRLPRRPRGPLPRGSWVLLPKNARPSGKDRTGAPLFRLAPEDLVRVSIE